MTMHIYFNQDKDGYKNGWSGYIERTLARRFCENGVAIPYQTHLDNVYDAEQVEKKAKESSRIEKEKAYAEKKAELLNKKGSAEKADSKKQKEFEKAVKK